MDFKQKYLKYKFKYLQAKKLCNQIKKRRAKNMKGGHNTLKQDCTVTNAIEELIKKKVKEEVKEEEEEEEEEDE